MTYPSTQEKVFDILDTYAVEQKASLDRHQQEKDSGLIKSYMLETSPIGPDVRGNPDYIKQLFNGPEWELDHVGDDDFYHAILNSKFTGFIEPVSSRHLIFHSYEKTQPLDGIINKIVKESVHLDFVWIAGNYFDLLWKLVIQKENPNQYVAFKFEQQSWFERGTNNLYSSSEGDDGERLDEQEAYEAIGYRATTLSITDRVRDIGSILPELQRVYPAFKVIKMLRFPAPQIAGGYDFWNWGKVTYRAPNFRAGRSYMLDNLGIYQQTTETIEQKVWFQTEKTRLHTGGESMTITGTPIYFRFPKPLDLAVFDNFINLTFEKGQGPFHLWGNPLRLSERKVHVYGIDLHLWQKIYLELTPNYFLAVLPKGTCGNTIHRLVSNLQRYIAPEVETFIGDEHYEELIRKVLLGVYPTYGRK